MKILEEGITVPRGFEANGISCGIKEDKELDLALIYSEVPAVTAGLFTSSNFPAHHIILDRKRLKKGYSQAVIINSGNANCAIGRKGLEDAERITQSLAKELGIDSNLVLMASTGIIGKRLPLKRIERAISSLVREKGRNKFILAAKAIMTTDKHPKYIAVEFKISGTKIRMGAMAKGAGMISPHLATMLCFITTDLDIRLGLLRKALKEAVEVSFNRISVDGEMSTNDTILIMANGLAGNKKIESPRSKEFFVFREGLEFVCQYLAREIVYDGEGATKFITVRVKGAKDKFSAEKIARTIGRSPLFKTAMYGGNPNWGRIVACCGASGVNFKPEKLEIRFGEMLVFKNGNSQNNFSKRLKDYLKRREIEVEIDLNLGREEYLVWTTD
ncbi:MAG: bifunctional glutamate N-acetyltransferase/amino-acid acetyltransferase ArgJ, partial [Candidatus Omnitrophica bacterium]|nr:bifunctional glutamate N-acetyltransferase/amino-acid acetyltransferase ArgJ [Candidatus Omnitrophota bacterium]